MAAQVSPEEVEFVAVRAQGPGGQNVNKVSSAVQLRFDIAASSLPDAVKDRLLARADRRLGKDGVLTIKAQSTRSQEQNKQAALARLNALVEEASLPVVARRKTKPTYGFRLRRLESKAQRGSVKASRAKVQE